MDFASLPSLGGLSSDARQWTPEQWLAHVHHERTAAAAASGEPPTQADLQGLYRRAVLLLPADGQSEAYARILVEYGRLLSDAGLNDEAEEQFKFARTLSRKFAFTHVASAQFELSRGNRAAGQAHLLAGVSLGAEPRSTLVNALSLIDRGDARLLDPFLPPNGDSVCHSSTSSHNAAAACRSDQLSSSTPSSGDSQEQQPRVLRDLTNSGSSSSSIRRIVPQRGRAPLRDLPVMPLSSITAGTYCASASDDVECSDGHLRHELGVRQTSAAQRVIHHFPAAGPPAAIAAAATLTATALPHAPSIATSAGCSSAPASHCPAGEQRQQQQQLDWPTHGTSASESATVASIGSSSCRASTTAAGAADVQVTSAFAQATLGRPLSSHLREAASSSNVRKDRASAGIANAGAAATCSSRDGAPITDASAVASTSASCRALAPRRPSDVLQSASDADALPPVVLHQQPNRSELQSSFLKSGASTAAAAAAAASAFLSSRSDTPAAARVPNLLASSGSDAAQSGDDASSSTLDPSLSCGWSQGSSSGTALGQPCRTTSAAELVAVESRPVRRGVYAPPPPMSQQQQQRCTVVDHGTAAAAAAEGCFEPGPKNCNRSGFLTATSAGAVAISSPHDEFDTGSRQSRHDLLMAANSSTRRSLSAGRAQSTSSSMTAGGSEANLRTSGIYATAAPTRVRQVGIACDDRLSSGVAAVTSAPPNSCFLPMRVPAGTTQTVDLESDEDDDDVRRGYSAQFVGSSGRNTSASAISRRSRTASVQTEPQQASSMGVCELVVVKDKEYYVLSVLGRGGSSQVRRVFDPREKTVLALKTVNLSCCAGIPDHGQALEFFAKEIRILERLQAYGNQVVKMLDFDHDRSTNELHIVLECGDVDLATLLRNRMQSDRQQQLQSPPGSMVLPDQPSGAFIRSLWVDMLHAVAVLHKEGIIHCDLKPANFVLVAGRVKLIDFGIANELEDDVSSIALEHAAGTLNFMAPEVLCPAGFLASTHAGSGRSHDGTDGGASAPAGHDKRAKIGVRADIWSLGCILYYAVYGRTPFQLISNSGQKIAAITNSDYPVEYPPVADCHLLDTMKICLVRNPRQRATIEQLLQHPYVTGTSSLPLLQPNGTDQPARR